MAAGYTESNDGQVSGYHGKRDMWVVKLDNAGNLQWQKAFGGSAYDEGTSLQLTSDGGFIVAGSSESNDGDVSGNHQALGQFRDFWVLKLNGDGSLKWQKCFGGNFGEEASYVQESADGSYVVSGYSESANGDASCNAGYHDMWVIKIGINGELLWQKSMGGSGTDEAYCAQPLSDGSVIVAGLTTSAEVPGYHVSTYKHRRRLLDIEIICPGSSICLKSYHSTGKW